MVNLFFNKSTLGHKQFKFNSMSSSTCHHTSYFSFILFNSIIGITLLVNLSVSNYYGFIIIFLFKFGLLPFISLVFNYISYITIMFLLNYLFLKLSYFCIYIIIANGLTYSYIYRELIVYFVLISLIMLFILSVSLVNHLISFNLYSLVSSSFNYFILIILQTITYNSIFTFLYVLFYTYNASILYYIFSMELSHNYCSYPTFNIITSSPSFNFNDLASLSTFTYLFHASVFIFLLVLSGLLPFYIFFIKLFSILFASTYSLPLVILLSFIIFFIYPLLFMSISLSSLSFSYLNHLSSIFYFHSSGCFLHYFLHLHSSYCCTIVICLPCLL